MKNNNSNNGKYEGIRTDLKMLAESHHLEILHFLKNGKESSVGQISDHMSASFKATSKHLLLLAKKGILERHYDGPFVLYKISENLSDLNKSIISQL